MGGVLSLGAVALGWDVFAKKTHRQTISEWGWDHPKTTVAVVGALAAHLILRWF